MNPDPYRIILRPLITEKSATLQQTQNTYLFEVAPKANKIQIRQALETIYKDKKLSIESVRTLNVKGKFRRVRIQAGYTKDRKKALVTLKKGQTLDLA
mgnify:CR=1 FL=1